MMLNMLLPTLERRYAIVGSVIGALTPLAFAAGILSSGSALNSYVSEFVFYPAMAGAAVAFGGGLGYVASRIGRRIDRTERMLTTERMGVAQLYHTAYHDALTGLGNRHALSRDFSSLLDRSAEAENSGVLLLLDLDRFKYINDTLGHSAGDEVLMALTRRLRAGCGHGYRLYRLGGDEFVILCDEPRSAEEIGEFAVELTEGVFRPVHYSGYDIDTSGSIGVTFIGKEDGLSEVLKRADLALYNAKEIAGASHAIFSVEMDEAHKLRNAMEKDLRSALSNAEFRIAYQPVVTAGSMVPEAFAAQICWKHPDYGDVAPDLFLPLAQQSDVITLIDRWIVKTVIAQVASWPQDLQVVIAMTSEEIARPDFASQFAAQLAKAGVQPGRFIFDVDLATVSARSINHARANIAAVRAMGSRIATTGSIGGEVDLGNADCAQSDCWRVDMARLRPSPEAEPNGKIARILVDLAETLGMTVRFTGVADDADLAFVSTFSGSLVQGDFTGARLSAAQVAAYLHALEPGRHGPNVLKAV